MVLPHEGEPCGPGGDYSLRQRIDRLEARVSHLDSVTEELRKLLCGQIERVAALEAYKCRCVCIACQEGNHDACYFPDDPDPDEAVGTVGVALPGKGGA